MDVVQDILSSETSWYLDILLSETRLVDLVQDIMSSETSWYLDILLSETRLVDLVQDILSSETYELSEIYRNTCPQLYFLIAYVNREVISYPTRLSNFMSFQCSHFLSWPKLTFTPIYKDTYLVHHDFNFGTGYVKSFAKVTKTKV